MELNFCKSKLLSLIAMVIMVLSLAPFNVFANDINANDVNPNDNNGEKFVMMNVPYSDFYGEQVDAVTSATKKKTQNERLVAGSYHTQDGSKILGVTCPVKITDGIDLSKYKKVNSEAELFSAEDYSYADINYVPSFYLEATNNAGALKFNIPKSVEDAKKKVNPDVGEVITDDHHVDYAIKLKNAETFLLDSTKVFGVKIKGYGSGYSKKTKNLTQLNNIFAKNQIGGSKEDFGDFIGGIIENIIYYTSDGIYEINNIRLNVPKIVDNKNGEAIKVDDAPYGTGSTKVKVNLPQHYIATYYLDGNEIEIDNGRIVTKNLSIGTHKLTAKDRFKEFSNIDAIFTITTDKMPAKYDGSKAIIKNDNATDEEFNAYLNNITRVQIKVGNKVKSYKINGRHGVPIIDKKTGKLDFESDKVARIKADFPDLSKAEVTIMSAGYPELSFELKEKTEDINGGNQNDDKKINDNSDKNKVDTNKNKSSKPQTGDESSFISLILAGIIISGLGISSLKKQR